MTDQLTLKHFRVIHPECGAVVLVTRIDSTDCDVEIEAICPDCDKYVTLQYRTWYSVHKGRYSRQTPESVTRALIKSGGNITEAARLLGCDRQTIRNMMQRGAIDGSHFPASQSGRPRHRSAEC